MPFIQEQNQIREDYKIKKKFSPHLYFLKSRTTKGLLFVTVFAVVVPVLFYYFIIDTGTYETDDSHTCFINRNYRIQCGDFYNVTLQDCDKINCCYDNSTKTCFHYLPSKYYYFQEDNEKDYKASLSQTPFQKNQNEKVALTINHKSETNVEIVLHSPEATVLAQTLPDTGYNCSKSDNPMYVEIYRKGTDQLLLTTYKGPTIVSERYWEWSFQLTDEYLFGLGQVLIQVEENSTFTKVVYANELDHNTLPLFIAYKNGSYHGLIVKHSGPLEVTVLPSLLVSLKSLAGNKILLELCIGPTLKDVITQLKDEQNSQVDLDLWKLGVHVCREGDTLDLKNILNEYNSASFDFKYESDCIHENLLMALSKDESQKDQLVAAIADLKDNKTKQFILSLPPQILVNSSLYEKTKNFPVFYKNEKGIYQGKYLGSKVIYPYFGHDSIGDYTTTVVNEIKNYLQLNNLDDLVLSRNWPADESFKMGKTTDFQYLSKDLIDAMSSTLPWNLKIDTETQMERHNDYGTLQLTKMKEALESPNIFSIMTASHNDLSAPTMIQNYDISWETFQSAIAQILFNSLFGNYFTSIPVCGSTKNYDKKQHESLCIRWYLMASTAPIFRISSDNPRRDPDSLNSVKATQASKKAIDIRYSLRYYYYTVLKATQEPLMRPLFYDFPDDIRTFDLVDQYMVGPHILVAHPLVPDKKVLSVYLPESVDVWYEFWSGNAYDLASRKNGTILFDILETDWVGFIPYGSIIPINLMYGEEDTLKLKVALKCNTTDNKCIAKGNLLLDGSDLFQFSSDDTTLTISCGDVCPDGKNFALEEIEIYQHTDPSNTRIITNISNINIYNTSEVIYSDYS